MAYIDDQQDQLDPNNPQGQGQAPQVGGGSQVAGGSQGASSAGVGPGGTGGWTNIQAYLDANKGDTGSSQLLNKAVGDQFGQERSTMQGDASKYLSDAQSTADQNKITNDQANGYIDQAAKQYQYAGSDPKGGFDYAPAPAVGGEFGGKSMQKATPGKATTPQEEGAPTQDQPQQDYQGIVNKFQSALNDPYAGPREYNYGFGDKTQQYAGDLKDNGGFDQLMSGIYSKAAGSPLTSGQYDLQKQFDVNNQSLGDTRNSLNDQYAQLTADRDKTVGDTTSGLSNIEQGYRQNQNDLKDYLTGQGNDYATKQSQAEAAAKDAYNTDYTTGQTGDKSIAWDSIHGRADGSVGDALAAPFRNANIWGDNLTYKQLQDENNNVGINNYSHPLSYFDYTGTMQPEMNARKDQLGTFYNNEDQKYAGTGDTEKRSFNAIQDFLNSTAARKDAGFHVRG